VVEKEAMKSVNSKLTMEEMLQRTPQGLETPKYEVIERITSLSSVYKNEGTLLFLRLPLPAFDRIF
jgi:hypothetical protein